MALRRDRDIWQKIADRIGEAFYVLWGRLESALGFPKPKSRRDTAALLLSSLIHFLFLGYVATTVAPRYILPYRVQLEEPVPVELIPPPAPIIKVPPPPPLKQEETPPETPPEPQPPKPEPTPPQPAPQAPAPAPSPPKPEPAKPEPPKPQPPKPSPLPAPVKPTPETPKPAPQTATPAPAPTPRPMPAQQTTPTPAPPTPTPGPPKPNPSPTTSPSPLNIHKPAQEAPMSVPRLPMAPAGGAPGTPGAAAGAASGAPGAAQPGGAQGSGLRPYPYGVMPSGGGGLRGTLVGCANADAVRLSGSERARCNERFGASVGAAPVLDGIAPDKRSDYDRAAAQGEAAKRYRGAVPTGTTPSPNPAAGAGLGPVPKVGD